jgi:excisionase family DNA binding protein
VTDQAWPHAMARHAPLSLDEHIARIVEAAVERKIGRYLSRLGDPEPLVYNVSETAEVLRTSTKTVRRLLSDGILPTVPHMGERILIPRRAVQGLVDAAQQPGTTTDDPPSRHERRVGLSKAG